MHRRHVLAGLAAGIPLFAGCSALTGGDGGNSGNGNGTNGTDSTGDTTTKGSDGATTAATTAAEATTQAVTPISTEGATATSAPTATEAPTATAAPTPAATTVATSSQTTTGPQATGQATATGTTTGGTTASGTTASGTTGGAIVIDPSQLTTYSSETYPYSIAYPAGWTVDASNPISVMIQPSTGFALEQIIVSEGMGGMTVDAYVSTFTKIFKDQFDTYEVTNRQKVTLPNGNPGIVLDTTIADASFQGNAIHGKYLFTVVDGTAYVVQLLVTKDGYTPAVEQGLTAIINSFTVQSA